MAPATCASIVKSRSMLWVLHLGTVGTTMASAHDWFYWALLSAVFAALTVIFAKLGLAGIDAEGREAS
jgi:hypothetical protein